MENHHFIVDLPINSMVDLSSSLCKRLPEGKPQSEYTIPGSHLNAPFLAATVPRPAEPRGPAWVAV